MRGGYQHRIRQLVCITQQQRWLRAVMSCRLPTLHPGIGVNACRFTDANIVIKRRTGELIDKRGQQLRFIIPPELCKPALLTAELPTQITLRDAEFAVTHRQGGRNAGASGFRYAELFFQRPLLPGADMPGLRPACRQRLLNAYRQPKLPCGFRLRECR